MAFRWRAFANGEPDRNVDLSRYKLPTPALRSRPAQAFESFARRVAISLSSDGFDAWLEAGEGPSCDFVGRPETDDDSAGYPMHG